MVASKSVTIARYSALSSCRYHPTQQYPSSLRAPTNSLFRPPILLGSMQQLGRRQSSCKTLPVVFTTLEENEIEDAEERVNLLESIENESGAFHRKEKPTLSSPLASTCNSGNSKKQLRQSIGQGISETPPWAIFLLNVVAVIWGSQHAVIKMVVDNNDAGSVTMLRFGLAAVFAGFYTPGLSTLFLSEEERQERCKDSSAVMVETVWRWGAEMGMWMFLGFAFQAIGLTMTTAQRSGFLLYLNVKFVPFFARFLLGRNISLPTWISAFTAFFGTALLALDGEALSFNEGDVWSLAAAAASAMFILRLETASKEVPDSAQLNAACLWVVALLSFIWTFSENFLRAGSIDFATVNKIGKDLTEIATSHTLELIYLSGVTTAFANWVQAKAQKEISAERASVIYSLDPVYGAVFSWVILGETLGGPQAWIGAGLITAAAASNAFLDFTDSKKAG